MTEREKIKKKITDNKNQRDELFNNLDILEFLVDEEELRTKSFDFGDPIILKNSWQKKTVNYLIMAVAASFLTFMLFRSFDFGKWWNWLIIVIMITGTISFFADFFKNKIVLEITNEGLTLDNSIFNKWSDIEFLYYKTVREDGLYLVERLKNGYEHEIKIDNLSWTTKELGVTLYHYMKKYGV